MCLVQHVGLGPVCVYLVQHGRKYFTNLEQDGCQAVNTSVLNQLSFLTGKTVLMDA